MIPIAVITPIGGPERAKYFEYWTALCRSMRLQSPGMSAPWFISSDHFTRSEWAAVKKEYPNARQNVIDPKRYDDAIHKGYPAFWKFEAANPTLNVHCMIALECDLLCDNDWSRLAYRCQTGLIHACKEPARDQFGAAIMVINRVAGYPALYERLLTTPHDGGWGTDQNIWNQMQAITEISNPNWSVEQIGRSPEEIGLPATAKGCAHPMFWNLWGKSSGEKGTTPYVWKRWEEIMGHPMPWITTSVSGKYRSIEVKP